MFKKIISYLKNFYNPVPDYLSPHGALYKRILNSSYERYFYKKLMVPDTLDGRFDLIILHIFVILKSVVFFFKGGGRRKVSRDD